MKHDPVYYIIAAVLICLGLGSCRAKKNLEKSETIQTRTERVERYADTTRMVEIETQRTDRSGFETDQSYTRVVEYDSTGSLRRLQETWRDRQRGDVVVQERSSELVSVTGSESEVIERDSSSVEIHETKHTTADSRPVQGFEWVWIIVGVVAAIFLILFFRRKLE